MGGGGVSPGGINYQVFPKIILLGHPMHVLFSKGGSGSRHDICQKIYATAVLEARILRKKHVNRDISQFETKEHKCFEMA